MKKYKLINSKTKEEYLCEKVTIDKFDYYVNDDEINQYYYYICVSSMYPKKCIKRDKNKHFEWVEDYLGNQDQLKFCKLIIATNNPNIDIAKVADKVEELADSYINNYNLNVPPNYLKTEQQINQYPYEIVKFKKAFIVAYNHFQSTHPYSDEDMIEFNEWSEAFYIYNNIINMWIKKSDSKIRKTNVELLELWKDQRVQTIYFN